MLPNWHFGRREGEAWGEALIIKENAPELLDGAARSRARIGREMRIFMSPVTDPYQPIERKLRLTRRCLEVFARYDDLDLLLIQTRAPAVVDDLDLIAALPYAWLGMTIETDRHDLPYGPTKSHIERRLEAVKRAVEWRGVSVQIAVSPCLPYSDLCRALAGDGRPAHRHRYLRDWRWQPRRAHRQQSLRGARRL